MIANFIGFPEIEIDVPTEIVISGGIFVNNVYDALDNIKRINKLNRKIKVNTLLSRDEILNFLALKNSIETRNNDFDIYKTLDSFVEFNNYASGFTVDDAFEISNELKEFTIENVKNNNFDEILSMSQKDVNSAVSFSLTYEKLLISRINHFFKCLNKFTGIKLNRNNDIEIYKLFSPILEMISFSDETGDDFDMFLNLEDVELNDSIKHIISKYPNMKEFIIIANNFNSFIDNNSKILIDYYNNSKTKYEHDDILFITDNLECKDVLFCDGMCPCEKDSKLNNLFMSVKCELPISDSKYRFIFSSSESMGDNVINIHENECLIYENGNYTLYQL